MALQISEILILSSLDSSGLRSFVGLVKFIFGSERVTVSVANGLLCLNWQYHTLARETQKASRNFQTQFHLMNVSLTAQIDVCHLAVCCMLSVISTK